MSNAAGAWVMAIAVPVAWAIDAVWGEPRNAWHPVAWLGRWLGPIGPRLCALPPLPAATGGAMVWWGLAIGLGGAAAWVQWQVLHGVAAALAGSGLGTGLGPGFGPGSGVAPWAALVGVALLLGVLLKPCFAWRMLRDEVAAVEAALAAPGPDAIDAARARLARIVSRDVSAFDADAIRETAIETLAENLNDSVVAPLCWFALLGLPGAVVYRLANTMDAMWGYRGRYEWAGKWAARADDALSWGPARWTAVLLWPVGVVSRLRDLRAEAARTPSPNGGWPMGAMALRLGVRLRKPGVYTLCAGLPSPTAADMARALRCATHAAWAAMVAVTVAAVFTAPALWAGRPFA